MKTPFEQGTIFSLSAVAVEQLPWNAHATCAGVSLKHLVTGAQTQGQFSCHLVRVEAGHEISEHVHAKNWELHEIVAGQGVGVLDGRELPYTPGNGVVIPMGEKHRVLAGDEDLYLLAKFVPALV